MRPRPPAVLLVLAAVFTIAVSWVLSGSPAWANHVPNPSNGNCTDHTMTCWPNCQWEWTGQANSLASPDTGPCNMPVQAWVAGSSGGSVQASIANWPSAFAINNWPEIQAVSGSVGVSGTVTADKGAGWPTGDPGQVASDVRIINGEDEPVLARATNPLVDDLELSTAALAFVGMTLGLACGHFMLRTVTA